MEVEDAAKRLEGFDGDEEQGVAEQRALAELEATEAQDKLQELLKSPPVLEEVTFETTQHNLFVACDTLGQDR